MTGPASLLDVTNTAREIPQVGMDGAAYVFSVGPQGALNSLVLDPDNADAAERARQALSGPERGSRSVT